MSEHDHALGPERNEEDRSWDPSKSNDHRQETKTNNLAMLSQNFATDSRYLFTL